MPHHVIRAGESLSSIAARYRTSWQVLARINHLQNPNRVAVGQRLLLPDVTAPATHASPAAATPPQARPAPPPVAAAPPPAAATPATPGGPGSAVAGDVSDAQLRAIMPNAGDRAATYLGPLNAAMRAHGIDTNERRAAFLAQISVESDQLQNTVENLNYSAPRLRVVWPRRFPTDELAERYDRDPEALGNFVYSNRLGNGDAASGDGYRYRGRGLMQVTGRDNYRAAGFEGNPEALAEPNTAADSAGRFWSQNGLNARTAQTLAREDFNGVSRTVNGGDNGSDERWAAYQRALRALQPQPE